MIITESKETRLQMRSDRIWNEGREKGRREEKPEEVEGRGPSRRTGRGGIQSFPLSLSHSLSETANPIKPIFPIFPTLFLSLFCIFPSLYLSHHQTPNISLWVKYTSIFIILDILTCNKINVFWKKNIFKCLNYNKILIKIYNK